MLISWNINKIEESCNYCFATAEYYLEVNKLFSKNTRHLCEEHKLQWYNKTLKL